MHRAAALSTFLLLFAATASAQSFGVYATGGYSSFNDNTIGQDTQFLAEPAEYKIDNGVRIGAKLGFSLKNYFGHEFSYAFQRSNLSFDGEDLGGFSIHNVYYNLLAHATAEDSKIRPFVTGGGGISTFFQPGLSSFSGAGRNKFGYNYGGGIKFQLSDKYGFRVDVRDHVTGAPYGLAGEPGSLHNTEYSMGFGLVF